MKIRQGERFRNYIVLVASNRKIIYYTCSHKGIIPLAWEDLHLAIHSHAQGILNDNEQSCWGFQAQVFVWT